MKVRAVRPGFYNLKRRKEGDVFLLHDPSHFSDVNRKDTFEVEDKHGVKRQIKRKSGWMEQVNDSTPAQVDKLNQYELDPPLKPTMGSDGEPVSLSGKKVPKVKKPKADVDISTGSTEVI